MTNDNGYYPIVAWLIAFGLIVLLSRSRIGYLLLVWFCIVSIIVVLAVGSPTVTKIMSLGKISTGVTYAAPVGVNQSVQ